MTAWLTKKDGLFSGDDFAFQVSIEGIAPTNGIVEAWCTVKLSLVDADPGLLQKVITSTATPGQGRILDDGTAGGTAICQFELSAINTELLRPGWQYLWDVQVERADGTIGTPLRNGILIPGQGVTASTA